MVDRLFGSVNQYVFGHDQSLVEGQCCRIEGPTTEFLKKLENSVARDIIICERSDLVEFAMVRKGFFVVEAEMVEVSRET